MQYIINTVLTFKVNIAIILFLFYISLSRTAVKCSWFFLCGYEKPSLVQGEDHRRENLESNILSIYGVEKEPLNQNRPRGKIRYKQKIWEKCVATTTYKI